MIGPRYRMPPFARNAQSHPRANREGRELAGISDANCHSIEASFVAATACSRADHILDQHQQTLNHRPRAPETERPERTFGIFAERTAAVRLSVCVY